MVCACLHPGYLKGGSALPALFNEGRKDDSRDLRCTWREQGSRISLPESRFVHRSSRYQQGEQKIFGVLDLYFGDYIRKFRNLSINAGSVAGLSI